MPIEVSDDDGRNSLNGSSRSEMSINIVSLGLRATGVVPNDSLVYYYPLQSPLRDSTSIAPSTMPSSPSTMPSSPSHIIAPSLSNHTLLGLREEVDINQQHQHPEVNEENCSKITEHILILFHLGLFAILGIFIRYGLQVLFGPNVINVTNDHSALYIDLPSNMVGCFFMGWVGVVFKRKISSFSEPLAIGLSSGLMGSITTFTSWIDQMVNLMIEGYWATSIIGLLIGMELAQMSLTLGIDSAKNWSQKTLQMVTNGNIAYKSHCNHPYGYVMDNAYSG
ncbi:hypothetical protein SUGI_0129410 [Cryptomeria japonica]|nr:hypothetical protein SUGI_0129410 [Cryptomeria japonica]